MNIIGTLGIIALPLVLLVLWNGAIKLVKHITR